MSNVKETPHLDLLLEFIKDYEKVFGNRPLVVSICRKHRSEIRKEGFQFRIGKWKNMPEMLLGRPIVENSINGRALCLVCEALSRKGGEKKS